MHSIVSVPMINYKEWTIWFSYNVCQIVQHCMDCLVIYVVYIWMQHKHMYMISREYLSLCIHDDVIEWKHVRPSRVPSQYPKRRLYVRSCKVSKPRDLYYKLSYRFEIWQAHRQDCCRSACQMSERSDNSEYKSRGFETRSYGKTSFRKLRQGPGRLLGGILQ